MAEPGRTYNAGNYRYGFNGKEKDADIDGNNYDYGARIYNPQIGRWLSVDPLQEQYSSLTPYSFVANTPLQAKDPDGKLIIFVNGFRKHAYTKYLFAAPSRDVSTDNKPSWEYRPLYSRKDIFGYNNGDSYWHGADNLFKERYKDYNNIYVDGGYTPHSTAQERYDRGVADAMAIIRKIDSKEIELKPGETIKLVGHSHGGWHSIGMADALSALGYPVEVAYVKNPHQPDGIVKRLEGKKDFRLVQYSTPSDQVSSDQSKLPHVLGLPVGHWMVGNSKLAQIPGAELKKLPSVPQEELGGHPVNKQIDDIKNIPKGSPGYVGKQ